MRKRLRQTYVVFHDENLHGVPFVTASSRQAKHECPAKPRAQSFSQQYTVNPESGLKGCSKP